ncbi:DUF998 domain-containing protein [Microbacterium sp. 22303]|uniref:DUF998 domain-containing protein n=1 Tax=Microbacterium sp. 22303 TaxID=3453905 RepID=UPI003F82C9DB
MTSSRALLIRLGSSLWGAAALWYLLCEAVAAIGFPGYSYATNWVSDLGVPERSVFQGRELNSLLANVMNTGFVGEGALFAIGAIVIFWGLGRERRRGAVITLGILHGIGISLVGMVHGSQANQDAGLTVFHFAGAALAIVSANALMILVGRTTLRNDLPVWSRRTCVASGIVGLVSLALLVVTAISGWVYAPVWERASVYSFLAASLLLAGYFFSARRAEERSLVTKA